MIYPSLFTFCPHCAAILVESRVGDVSRPRCSGCGWIQYRNPTVGVAVAVCERGRLLLGQRLNGGWCIPCGHVEWDETIEEAAVREMAEETGLAVAVDELLAVQSNLHDSEKRTVGVWFRGHRIGGQLQAGSDLVDVAMFGFDEIPPLAFPTDSGVIAQLRMPS